MIYYLNGARIFSYETASQKREFTGRTLPDGTWTNVDFTELVDGHLSVSMQGPGEEEYENITIDLSSGEVFRPNLEDGDRPVIVVAVTPDRYVVKLGGIPTKFQDRTPDGVPFENETLIPHFAMMKKEDFWNNRPNYEEFDNLAYENFSVV